MSTEKLILLGTHDEYIHSAIFDTESRTIRKGKTTKTEPHPSWLARHPHLPDVVYSVSWSAGKLFVLRLNGRSGEFETLDSVSTGGKGLNFMALSSDCSGLMGACYRSGNVVHVPLSADGLFKRDEAGEVKVSIFELPRDATPRPSLRQEAPHAHQIVIQGDEVIVPDLGSNAVWRLRFVDGQWEAKGSITAFEEGDGPRHLVMHPDGTHMYSLCELSSTLVAHRLTPSGPDATATVVSRHSILPPADKDNHTKMLASEIILLPPLSSGNKHLLICTNRDSPNPEGDAIALFSVDQDGSVERTEQKWMTGLGRHLRGMLPAKEGRFVAVAGRDEGGLKVFERDQETGLTLTQVAEMEVEQVVVPLWID